MEGLEITSRIQSLQSGMKAAFAQSSSSLSVPTETKTVSASLQDGIDELDKGEQHKKLMKELTKLTEELNREMNPLNLKIRFGYDDRSRELFVSVFEKDSNTLIRKFPTDEAIELMVKMKEINGMIFDKKA